MRRTARAAVAVATAALGVGVAAGPASASSTPGATTARMIGVIHVNKADHRIAQMRVRYTCSGTPDQIALWVSVKQTADRTADPALAQEGSSRVAAAWSQSHKTYALKCDGTSHVSTFRVTQFEQGFGSLEAGKAWFQFCLFDKNYPLPATEAEQATAAPFSSMEFRSVRVGA